MCVCLYVYVHGDVFLCEFVFCVFVLCFAPVFVCGVWVGGVCGGGGGAPQAPS